MSALDSATLPAALPPQQLRQICDPAQFQFDTTAELEQLDELIGQTRAMEAVRFCAGIHHPGYNMFVLGPSGMGKRTMVTRFLEQQGKREPEPEDWCYLNNFDQPHKPQAVHLATGRGAKLRQQMEQLVEFLRSAIPALFESDEYRAKANAIQAEFSKRQEQAFKELAEEAQRQQVVLLRTPGGFAFAPTRDGEAIPPDDYANLPQEERERITKTIATLQTQLEGILSHLPQWWKERTEHVTRLNHETILSVVNHALLEPRKSFADEAVIQRYLDRVQQDIMANPDDFRKDEESADLSGLTIVARKTYHRYQVNVLASNGKQAGAPIISEHNPTYSNLVGRVEHVSQLGALVTDFTLIKPGALHRANGGYLLLDVRKILAQPFAWDALKRALQAREICIESLGQMYSLVSTVSLEPEPIPLRVKIVLFGDRIFYYLLQQYDPDFSELFKVAADFEDRMERSAETHVLYARLMATLCAREKLLALDRGAVCRVIEHSARSIGDTQRLSTHMRSVTDLLQEADFWARQEETTAVSAVHVQKAIDAQIRRRDRLRVQLQEAILRDTLLIDTHGSVVGQINGLSVLELGDFSFAQPIRITATTRFGQGDMVNIEREVKLSGAIHSKGVLILSAFLATRYARDQPLALSASLVFEQSYGQVDGDSASLAELCALISSIARTPIQQAFGVTGSVNQLGQVQAIGAVNEKIEGFYDICAARGLRAEHGVLIPSANVKHLMLRQDVVAAAQAGHFHIYAVDNVDQAMALLTGVPAGEPDALGQYPKDSINFRIAARIAELTALRRAFAHTLERQAGSIEQQE